MKSLILAATLALSVTAFAQSSLSAPPGSVPGRDQLPGHEEPSVGQGRGFSCAPEVVDGNMTATERTLKTVLASADFAQASQFKSLVSQISSLKNPSAKVAQYFALIGVDSRDSAAVAEFIGAREIKSQWLSSLERSAQLTSAQADFVASKLQTALRGSLQ